MPIRPLTRRFFTRPAHSVAPVLLNKLLVVGNGAAQRSGRIVEVEAYGGSLDPASHAYRGQTARNATMFGPPGHLYVYFTYGMHWCANVVCARTGVAEAVLIRALRPETGIDLIRLARPSARRERDLCRGPARLTQALGINGLDDGVDLVASGRIGIVDDRTPPPLAPAVGPRVGVGSAADVAWRWWVADDPNVSDYRRRGA